MADPRGIKYRTGAPCPLPIRVTLIKSEVAAPKSRSLANNRSRPSYLDISLLLGKKAIESVLERFLSRS